MYGKDEERVRQAVAGDEVALSELLEQFGLQVCGEIERKLGARWKGRIDPDDVMQVTYLEAFLRIQEFLPAGPASFLAWLRRIADNNLKDAMRDADRRMPVFSATPAGLPPADDSFVALVERLGATSTTASRVVARHEMRQHLEAALQQLPQDYERVLRLCELEERSGLEAAAEMGRSHGAIKMLLARARERLSELLGSGSIFFSKSA